METPQTPHTVIGPNFVVHRNPGRWPGRCALKKEFRRLVIAHSDISAAYNACDHLLALIAPLVEKDPQNPYAPMQHPLYAPLLQAAIICYARPFVQARGSALGALHDDWAKFKNLRMREVHRHVIDTRHSLVAHSDPLRRTVSVEPPGSRKMMGHHSTSYGFGIRSEEFSYTRVLELRATAGDLGGRLLHAIEKGLEQLYGGMDSPGEGFKLRLSESEDRINNGL